MQGLIQRYLGDSANTDAISSKLREVNSLKKIQIRGYFESKKENISHKRQNLTYQNLENITDHCYFTALS